MLYEGDIFFSSVDYSCFGFRWIFLGGGQTLHRMLTYCLALSKTGTHPNCPLDSDKHVLLLIHEVITGHSFSRHPLNCMDYESDMGCSSVRSQN